MEKVESVSHRYDGEMLVEADELIRKRAQHCLAIGQNDAVRRVTIVADGRFQFPARRCVLIHPVNTRL